MKSPSITTTDTRDLPRKTIGLLTSGGDCAGLNAVIRAVVTRAVQGYGWRVYGIHQGTMGLLRRPVEFTELDLSASTTNILRLAGTILGTTNKGDPFAFPMPDGTLMNRSAEVVEAVRQIGLVARRLGRPVGGDYDGRYTAAPSGAFWLSRACDFGNNPATMTRSCNCR